MPPQKRIHIPLIILVLDSALPYSQTKRVKEIAKLLRNEHTVVVEGLALGEEDELLDGARLIILIGMSSSGYRILFEAEAHTRTIILSEKALTEADKRNYAPDGFTHFVCWTAEEATLRKELQRAWICIYRLARVITTVPRETMHRFNPMFGIPNPGDLV